MTDVLLSKLGVTWILIGLLVPLIYAAYPFQLWPKRAMKAWGALSVASLFASVWLIP